MESSIDLAHHDRLLIAARIRGDEYRSELEACCEREQARWNSEKELRVEIAALQSNNEWCHDMVAGLRKTTEKQAADLATARAALESLRPAYRDSNGGWLEHIIEPALSRLGTGEALAVVREAQRVLKGYMFGTDSDGESHNNDEVFAVLDRFLAVFGE